MAIAVLLIGAVMFFIGIVGQVGLGQRFRKQHATGDRRGARLVLTLAALIVGAWLVIISASALLKKHSQHQAAATASLQR